ncbi:MAG: tyrosine-type recombinase/integrase [Nitrosopumilaceae archaeon]
MQVLENDRSYRLFDKAIKSPKTKVVYHYLLKEFLSFTKCNTYDEIILFDVDKLQKTLEDYLLFLEEKGLKGSSIKTRLAPVLLFLDMNKKSYHKRVLRNLIPSKQGRMGGEAPFTTEEIRRMLNCTTKLRTRALIHFLASTGVRPNAIADPVLRMKHLENIDSGCKAVKIYDDSDEAYWSFLTPEASKALDDYIKSRKLNGEDITDESPIFTNSDDAFNVKNDYLSVTSLKHIITYLLKAAGIERTKTGARYNKATSYGFRKRFNGILKMNNSVNSNIAEKLMAHKNGLDGVYLKPTRDQCFNEFVKAIIDLTIDDSERNKIKMAEMKNELSEKDQLKIELENVKEKFELDHQFVQMFAHMVEGVGIQLIKPDGMPYEIEPEVINKAIKQYVEDKQD